MPFSTFIPKIQNFDSSVYMLGWGVVTLDGLYTLQSLVKTKTGGAEGSFNFGRVSDAEVDKLVEGLKITTDTKKRDQMMHDALKRTRDEAFYVPLHHQLRPWAMKKGVTPLYDVLDRHHARFTTVK
jgi:peptide/nickel transport system substrate-binding protein